MLFTDKNEEGMSVEKKQRRVWWLTLGVTLLLLVLLLWGLWSSGFFRAVRTPQGIHAYIEHFAPYSHLVYFLVQLSSVILAPIPSNVIAAAGGLLFGTVWAFLLTVGAVTLGSVVVFQLSRVLGKPFAESFVNRRNLDKYGDLFRKKRDLFLFLALLFPFFPDDILCIMAGLTDVPFRRYLLLVLLARPWGLLVACAVGDSVLHIPLWGMVALGIAGAALFLLALKFGDRVRDLIIEKLKH